MNHEENIQVANEPVMTEEEKAALLPVPDEEIEPVVAIVGILTVAGHPNPKGWLHGINPMALDESRTRDERRFLVNRQLRAVIGELEATHPEIDTSTERYCLVDTGSLATWVRLFEESVLPLMLAHNLPK